MHKVFRTTGKLHLVKDASGKPVSNEFEWPVIVNAMYELKPSPQQPVIIEIYGQNLIGMGQTLEKLVLDNGITLTGRTIGGGGQLNTREIKKMRMFDLEQGKIVLRPTTAGSPVTDIDSVVFGVVSSNPLGRANCSNGVARPGFPFSFRETFPEHLTKTRWSSHALRLHYRDLEIIFVGTSKYWKKLVARHTLQHDSIVGVRKSKGRPMSWDEFNDVATLLSNFLGWIDHCVSPVFHVKAYKKRKLVYRGYDLYPHATIQRDEFSWLPRFGSENEHGVNAGRHADNVQDLLNSFVQVWDKNIAERGIFHLALQMLRSREKGSPNDKPAIGYMRDTFTACDILLGILIGSNSRRSRHDVMLHCIKQVGVENELPSLEKKDRVYVIQKHPELWWAEKRSRVLENDREEGKLNRPLANVENWLLHIGDPKNAKMLLGLPISLQQYLLDVSIWLADLMLLKVVGYCGPYFNRLTHKTETVPWVK